MGEPKFTTLEEDTPIRSRIIAEVVVGEAEELLGFREIPDRESFVRELVDEQARLYQINQEWRRKMRAGGNKGRDTLYAFMRHWLTSDVKRRIGLRAADKLGRDFANGVFHTPTR